jgi:hypothetical protein
MGCDIHVYFETRQPDGSWAPTFQTRPSKWWSEELAEDLIENGSAITALGPPTDDDIAAYVAYRKAKNWSVSDDPEVLAEESLEWRVDRHFETLDLTDEEIEARYGALPKYNRNFFPRELCDIGEEWCSISSRSYNWFAAISREAMEYRFSFHEDDKVLLPKLNAFPGDRGVPDDVSPVVGQEIKRWSGDGHSHSWLMCREILDEPKCLGFEDAKQGWVAYQHRIWIERNIPDPDNTRMVYFFDN